ncbi:MAG: type IX secretion system membrane protein PorP/SprF [Spirochaetes bacterium]|nr:type IX secretion system membrane protein PorP/SprF [Spirochaetota bacterium]
MKKNILFIIYLLTLKMLCAYNGSIQSGVKNAGMGFTGVSYYAHPSSMNYNPSLLLAHRLNQISMEYTFNDNRALNLYNLNYLKNVDKNLSFGLDLVFFKPRNETVLDSSGGILTESIDRLHVLTAGAAFKMEQGLNGGLNIKILNHDTTDGSLTLLSLSPGLLYSPSFLKDLNCGISFQNLLLTKGELNGQEKKEPFNIKAGLSYKWDMVHHDFLISADFNSDKDDLSTLAAGLEYTLYDRYSLRIGYNEQNEFTMGAGLTIASFQMGYAYHKHNTDGINHTIGVTYLFPYQMSLSEKEYHYRKGIMYYNDFNFERSLRFFKPLYESDRHFRETAYYYDLLEKRLKMERMKQARRFKQAEELYQEAILYYKGGDEKLTVRKLIDCLKINPKHQDAKELLYRIRQIEREKNNREKAKLRIKEGDSYLLESNLPAALVEYQQALILDPENEAVMKRINKARTELSRKDVQAIASRLFTEGENLYQSGLYSKAIMKWKECLAAKPDFLQAREKIDRTELTIKEGEEKRLLDRITSDRIDELISIVKYQMDKKEYEQALLNIEELLELDPANSLGKGLRSQIIQSRTSRDKDQNNKNKALAKNHFEKAAMFQRSGKWESALFHLAKVVYYDPSQARSIKELKNIMNKISGLEAQGINQDSAVYRIIMIHYLRGMEYYKNERYQLAAGEWKRVLKMVPFHPQVNSDLSGLEKKITLKEKDKDLEGLLEVAYHYFSSENYKNAREVVNRILALDPENAKARELAQRIEEREVDMDLARVDKKRIIKLYSEGVDCYVNRDYDKCITSMKAIIQIDPDNIRAMKFIEKAKEKIKETSLVEESKKKEEEKKKVLWQHYIKGINYYKNDLLDRAIREWEKALKIDPDNDRIKNALDKARVKQEMIKAF